MTPAAAHAATAQDAAAASTGAGAAFCSPYDGTSTSGASLDDVYPCANPDIDDSFGYQCTEFSSRFESVVYGLGGVEGPGADVVEQLHDNDGVAIASPGPGVLPVPGDVVSMWGANQDPLGHTGVVSEVSVNSSGTGAITYLDENGSLLGGESVGQDTINVNDWVWSVDWGAPYDYNQFDFSEQGTGTATGGSEVAFQANTGDLWTVGSVNHGSWGIAMMAGTSPSIAEASNGSYEVAFQASNGNLTLAGSAGTSYLGLGMMAGTSPAITALSNGSYEVTFQANTGDLYTYSPATGATHLGLGLMAGTSPAITALSNGSYEVTFQANTGDLYTYSPATGATNLALGMMSGTSPAITG
ncbi:MAG TPA: CHAP domain-containing protein [Streptosporangiaceae bacterium]|nr:CHAP domain-containing protein [Streptosporangiaceae bacterium]